MDAPSTRRRFIASSAGLALAGGIVVPGAAGSPVLRRRSRTFAAAASDLARPRWHQREALRVLGRDRLRLPDSRFDETTAAGTDLLPQVEHIVVVMMENHSYDNLLGMLGRGPFQTPRGDGFTLAADGYPANANPQVNGTPLRAFRMPTTCQFSGGPTQEWAQAHIQYANGTNEGFVVSGSGDVAMGYWTGGDLPFTYALASTFPIGDRYFCSMLGQTDPNRRFLFAATSMGMTDDIPDASQDAVFFAIPPNGTIFNRLSAAGISWTEYSVDTSATGVSSNLYPTSDATYDATNVKPIADFFTDAAAGALPSFTFLDPNYDTESQEDPQNIVVGEAWLRTIVEAVGTSPKWGQTLLVINYDEHGGYYDHVPPPAALAPDGIAPVVQSGESVYDGFRRYGFRVPCIVVSPYAKPGYVSHAVYDHTSVLALIERKFNLPAMTLRDANANDMLDFLDLDAMAAGRPTFPEFPALAQSGSDAATLACSSSGPGRLPVPQPAALPFEIRLGPARVAGSRRSVGVSVQASRSGLSFVSVELRHGSRVLASRRLASPGVVARSVTLRPVRGGRLAPGRYEVVVTRGHATLARRAVVVHR